MKSSVEQIRERFANDVERFSNLEPGQAATIDSPLAMELIAQAAAAATPKARRVLDVGCGAGNYTLRLLQLLPNLDVTLVDLSLPMLTRAQERIRPVTNGDIAAHQADIRLFDPGVAQVDIILAASTLHHLREEAEWEATFAKFHAALRPGGSLWIFDLIEHSLAPVQSLMWARYGDYLVNLKDAAYRDTVYQYVEQEDTPRSLLYQVDLLRQVGFEQVEILHKNNCFAAFGALRA